MDFEKTIYEDALGKGVSRRDFLKACTALTAVLGLDYSQTSKVVQAMETNKRVPVIWLQLMDCTGCSESFIRSSHPRTENVLLDMISLEYSEVLSAAAGDQIEENREKIMKEFSGEYILAVEGNVTDAEFLTVAGHSALKTLQETAKHAKAVIAYGSCAAWGGIAAAKPNPTNARAVSDVIKGVPVMNVPGCPPIAEVMTGVIAHVITFGRLPELDSKARPKAFYKLRIHDKCNRRAYFDAGLFVESFDDEGAKIGYCLYKVGCQGPTTYNSCAEMRWNGGVSYPIQSGNPCIGCSEKDFWDEGPFFTRRTKVPGTKTAVDPMKVGKYATGATVAGIAAHGTVTALKKNHDEKKSPNNTEVNNND